MQKIKSHQSLGVVPERDVEALERWLGNALADLAATVTQIWCRVLAEISRRVAQWQQRAYKVSLRLAFVEAWHRASAPTWAMPPAPLDLPEPYTADAVAAVWMEAWAKGGHTLTRLGSIVRCTRCLGTRHHSQAWEFAHHP